MAAHLSFPAAGRNISQNADLISPSLKNASIELAGDAASPAALRTGRASCTQAAQVGLAWPLACPSPPPPHGPLGRAQAHPWGSPEADTFCFSRNPAVPGTGATSALNARLVSSLLVPVRTACRPQERVGYAASARGLRSLLVGLREQQRV